MRYTTTILLLIILVASSSYAQPGNSKIPIKPYVKLDVPTVKQSTMLCGPATIEMLFRYWGIDKYDQYAIARNILLFYPDTPRVVKSGILKSKKINWKKYPGTGTSVMRRFLRRFGNTYNSYLEHLPSSYSEQKRLEAHHFAKLKRNLSQGVPVIVHQKSPRNPNRGHYRLVVGYNESSRIVYLNDAAPGRLIEQSYYKFLSDWNVNERWLHYNALAFNFDKLPLEVHLPH